MIEYCVRIIDHDGTGETERQINREAKDGWRLVTVTSPTAAPHP